MNLNLDYVKEDQRDKLKWQHEINHCQDKELSVRKIEKGVIIPERLDDTAVVVNDDFSGQYIDEDVVYIGSLMMAWGHWYTDNIARLWFLQYEEQYSHLKNLRYCFCNHFPGDKIPDNSYIVLENLGIKRSQIFEIYEETQFRNVYYADDCYIRISDIQTDYTKEFVSLFDFLVDNINNRMKQKEILTDNTPRKLYFSREKVSDGKDYGEHYLREIFQKLGYTVLYPNELDLYQQVNYLQNADEMCATEGSIAHNAIFMKPGSKVIVLRKADYFNSTQPTINQLKDLDVTYIDAHKSICTSEWYPWTGPFFLYNSKWLQRYTKIRGRFPLFDFVSYYYKNSTKVRKLKMLPIRIINFIKRRLFK